VSDRLESIEAAPIRPLAALVGVVLLLLSALTIYAWLARDPRIFRLIPGAVMVINTAVCFGLVAVALLSNRPASAACRRLQAALGIGIALISGLVLMQYLVHYDLGIDHPAWHRWYHDDNPYPGRMSPPTAFAFVLCGATLALIHNVRSLWNGLLVQTLTGAVIVIGGIATAGYLLHLPLAYENYLFGQMAPTTAIGFIATGIALWSCWTHSGWYRARNLIPDEVQRISLNSAVVLASIIFVSVLAGLILTQRQIESLAKQSLLLPLKTAIYMFASNIDLRSTEAALIASRPTLLAYLRILNKIPDDTETLGRLRDAGDSFLQLGYTGLAFYGRDGKERLRVGSLTENPALAITLSTRQKNVLIWNDGYVLRTRMPMISNAEPVGVVIVEQRLSALTSALEHFGDFAETGQIVVCSRSAERLTCFPQRRHAEAFSTPYSETLPMARALANETGVIFARDYQGYRALTAYGPIGSLGLGMVARMDTTEIYAPLRQQLWVALVLTILLVAAGTMLLYARVTPLAKKLYLGEQRLKLALESSHIAWWDWDVRSGKIQLSEHWRIMLGKQAGMTFTTLSELEGKVHPDDRSLLQGRLRLALKSPEVQYNVEHRVLRPDGRWLWIYSVGKVIERDADGKAVRMIGVNADITQRKEAALKIEYQARHDMLTGLANRITFYDRLQLAMARARRSRRLMAVVYLDIDRFKQINDHLGHTAGDALLKGFAQRLMTCVRLTDSAARLGGDEFAVVLEELDQREDGCRIAEKIVTAMRSEFSLEYRTVRITTSAGIAFYDGNAAIGSEQLIQTADTALYEAKNEGRDNYQVAA